MCEGFSEHSSVQSERAASDARKRRMAPELIARTVREAVPHGLREIIPSTMGEPLMYRHFDVFTDLCREFAPRLKLNLTTNGSFQSNGVTPAGVAAWAPKLLPVLSDVKFSWNAATKGTQEAVMKRADYDAQRHNLEAFLRARDDAAALGGNRARVTLQLTFMEVNAPEFSALVAQAAALGVDRVKGHHLWAHWAEMEGQSFRRGDTGAVRRWNDIAARCRDMAAATPRRGGGRVVLQGFEDLPDAGGSQQVRLQQAIPSRAVSHR
jgi:MoaA/NifB/PqqE/SkfB family radical SAM enzyme